MLNTTSNRMLQHLRPGGMRTWTGVTDSGNGQETQEKDLRNK